MRLNFKIIQILKEELQNCLYVSPENCETARSFKMAYSRPFPVFLVFCKQSTVNKCLIKFADGWIQTPAGGLSVANLINNLRL